MSHFPGERSRSDILHFIVEGNKIKQKICWLDGKIELPRRGSQNSEPQRNQLICLSLYSFSFSIYFFSLSLYLSLLPFTPYLVLYLSSYKMLLHLCHIFIASSIICLSVCLFSALYTFLSYFALLLFSHFLKPYYPFFLHISLSLSFRPSFTLSSKLG